MKIRRLIRKKRFHGLLLTIALLIFVFEFTQFRKSDRQWERFFNRHQIEHFEIGYFDGSENRTLRYVEAGPDTLPLVVFIHGAPSSSSFWTTFFKDSLLRTKISMLAVDRPGYGYSDFGQAMPSVKEQANLIGNLLLQKKEEYPNIILLGSSYGGTVAARIAMDFPDLAEGVIFQSSALAPGEETTYWITYPTSHWSLSWLIPRSLKVTNAEKLAHEKELEAMVPLWKNITAYCVLLHGNKDEIVFASNAHFAETKLSDASGVVLHLVEDSGHDLKWTQRDLIVKSILNVVEVLQ